MPEFTNTDRGPKVPESRQAPVLSPSGKNTAAQFAAVRERGMLNAGLDIIAQRYEEQHPDRKVRWEHYTPNSDMGNDGVTMREGMGWKLADFADFNDQTESGLKSGIIRRGDLVLMHTDRENHDAYMAQDAEAAHADLQAAKTAFDEALDRNTKVKLSDGSSDQARGFGQIKVREEIHSFQPPTES